jgi:outer membrane protein assembly factor BamB
MAKTTQWFRSLSLAVALARSLVLTPAARAEDWPQWRGPNRDAVWRETGILETFPAGGLKVRWRAPVGHGFSSPVIAEGRVYLTDSQLARPNVHERVLCFDEATGRSLWTFSSDAVFPDWAFVPSTEPGANGTPIVREGRVYALGPNGHRLFCLEAGTGELLWRKDLAKEYQIDETTALFASPLIDSERLIVFVGGKPDAGVVAFDKNTGRESWRSLNESTAHSSPIIITAGGSRQLIVWTLQSVTSLDPKTGKPFWRESFPTGSSSVVSTPVVSDERLLIGGLMLRLNADKPGAAVVWPETRSPSRSILSSTSTALLQGGHVFSANSSGNLVCLDAATGKQVWETDKVTNLKAGMSSSIHLTVNGDSVLLFNDQGELIRARLTADGYREISRVALIEPTTPFGGRKLAWSAPAYANRHVFARNDHELICASLAATP